jgi:hypothetical protein
MAGGQYSDTPTYGWNQLAWAKKSAYILENIIRTMFVNMKTIYATLWKSGKLMSNHKRGLVTAKTFS